MCYEKLHLKRFKNDKFRTDYIYLDKTNKVNFYSNHNFWGKETGIIQLGEHCLPKYQD